MNVSDMLTQCFKNRLVSKHVSQCEGMPKSFSFLERCGCNSIPFAVRPKLSLHTPKNNLGRYDWLMTKLERKVASL